MDADSYKEWLVERIEYLLQSCVDELTSKRLQIEMLSERCLSKWNEVRNIVVGSVAFVATLLSTFLSIEDSQFWKEMLIWSLGIDIAVGIVAAFGLYLVRGGARKRLRNIQRAYLEHEAAMGFLKGFFAKWLLEVDKIDPGHLKGYFYLSGIVYGNSIPIYDAYVDGVKSHLLWGIKDEIKLERDTLKVNISRTKELYKSQKELIMAAKDFPKEPLEFIESLDKDGRF